MNTEPDYVVLGNGIAGTTAAEHLRRARPDARVTLITDEPYPLYHRIRLPFLLTRTVTEPELFIRDVSHHVRLGLDFRPGTRIKTLCVEDRVLLTERDEEIPFGKLLIATGARPSSLPGADGGQGIHYFRSLEHTRALLRELERPVRSAAVLGGSLIGYEIAAVCSFWRLSTTWLVRGPGLFHRELDEEGQTIAHTLARRSGVEVHTNSEPVGVLSRDGAVAGVRTRGGAEHGCDVVACGVGLRRNTGFLEGTGIHVKRGVLTDQYLETNVPGIFAAGDVAEFPDAFLGTPNVMGTWHNAMAQGQVAARNMLGERTPFVKMPFCVNAFFQSRIRFVGRTARAAPGLESLTRSDHRQMRYCRLCFEGDRLVGASVIGLIKFEARKRLMEAIGEKMPVSSRIPFLDGWFSNGFHPGR